MAGPGAPRSISTPLGVVVSEVVEGSALLAAVVTVADRLGRQMQAGQARGRAD
jgi:putative effector of murein hydrolase